MKKTSDSAAVIDSLSRCCVKTFFAAVATGIPGVGVPIVLVLGASAFEDSVKALDAYQAQRAARRADTGGGAAGPTV